VQVGIVDLREQRSQLLAGGQRGRAVAGLVGGGRGRPQQLGAGLRVQGAGGGQELADPCAGLAQDVAGQQPVGQQGADQVGQRRAVVAEVLVHGGGQVGRLGLQPVQPLALAGAAQVRFGLLG
jgi:hypothetical protein